MRFTLGQVVNLRGTDRVGVVEAERCTGDQYRYRVRWTTVPADDSISGVSLGYYDRVFIYSAHELRIA